MDEKQDWADLRFLMRCDTASFTRNLYIPTAYPLDAETLLPFLKKRGMRHFDRLRTSVDVIRQVEQVLGPFYLESYQYDLVSMEADDMRFQDFTTDIEMHRGMIHNIPNNLVNLSLKSVELSESVMEAIGQSKSLRSLDIGSGVVIRGLPMFLMKLTFDVGCDVTFDEDPKYNYDCEYLIHFEYRKRDRRGSSIRFPSDLSFWMIESLTYLSLTHEKMNNEGSFPDIFSKLQKLEELHLISVIVGNYPLPRSIKVLKIEETCEARYLDALESLPELTDLDMPCTEEFFPMMTGILGTSPNLTSLRIGSRSRRGPQPPLPTGIFPQLKTFYLDVRELRRTLTMWDRNNELFRVFPNLNIVQCDQSDHNWKADFPNKSLYIESYAWMYHMPRTQRGKFISLEDTEFEKFYFSFQGHLRKTSLHCNLRLPRATTEVSLTFPDHKRNSDGYLSRNYYADTTIQYNVRELLKKSGVASPLVVILRVFSKSDRIYADFSLENGTYVDHLFGQYKRSTSQSSSSDEHEDTDSD